MASLDGHFVPKHYPDQPSLTDHYLRRCFSEVEASLDQRETAWPDEVDLDELYDKNGLSVANDEFTPEETDVIFDSQYSTGTEEPDFHHFSQLLASPSVNQYGGGHVLVTTPEMDPPEDYYESEEWQSLASSLANLYVHYRRGVAKLDVMPTTVISDTPTVDLSSSSPPFARLLRTHGSADVQVQAAMSKTQHQLTIEEGKLWEKLTDPNEAVDNDESPTAAILASLREKSTFMESKNILQAMGVPCIDSTGPYEAEALAASLVLNGCADYVASEDTDVLVYGAPLLRNITSRDKALLLISGSEVRSALRLDARALVDFAILLGTDFAPRIRKIGPHRALQYIPSTAR
ncbi:hypothetical protein BJV77DRAFT_1069390 [Russula vinacea]|nr:hypothetical protein BJV77DRAFT_1069390 [Russula vinacea]